MDLLVLRAEARAAAARGRPALPEGAVWARFGDDLVVGGTGAAWQRHRAAIAPDVARVTRSPGLVPERLHVVVQTGRLFESHHPEVRVLHDRGRYLLVDIDPKRARQIRNRHPACYGLYPLGAGDVVFARGGKGTPRAAAPRVQALVDTVSRQRVVADVTRLAGMHTRHSTSSEYRQMVARAKSDLEGLGYAVRKQRIRVGGKFSSNLIADRAGSAASPRGRVYVTAHLDSVNLEDGITGAAPGADDNGSGSAGVLEMARVFAGTSARRDLRFVLFGGEEQGLFGSQQLVEKLTAAERGRVHAALNMDMIASTNTAERTVLLEGAAISSSMMDELEAAAGTYTGLRVERSLHPFNSDHVPFLDAGMPCVLTIEGADSTNDRVHSARDSLAHVDFDLAVEILRMNVAFVAAAIEVA